MGDAGFLARHQTQIRHHNVVGDNLRISGVVTAKGLDERGRPTVTIEQRALNQHGDTSALGILIFRTHGWSLLGLVPLFAQVLVQYPDDLRPRPVQIGAQFRQHPHGHVVAGAEEAEQNVLGADVAVAEPDGFGQ
jgi:hypothetical protein